MPVGDGLWVFGSGCLVASGRVLTARHVLARTGEQPKVGQACEVRAWPCGPAQDWLVGVVLWLHPFADAAIVEVNALGRELEPLTWGRPEGSDPLPWTATGFPVAALDADDRREETVFGRVAPGSAASTGRLALTVESRSARPDAVGDTGWAGLSGAAVLSGEALIGIVVTDPGAWAGSLDALRGTVILGDPEFTLRTGVQPQVEPVRAGLTVSAPTPGGPAAGERVVGDRISVGVETWRDRNQLRADLRMALLGGPAATRVLSVTGRRGIGKSATVAKVVAEFEQQDPSRNPLDDLDGVVYLSTRTGVGSVTLARVVDSLARLLPEAAAAMVRTEWDRVEGESLPRVWESLKGRRCAVVLDNLDDVQDQASGELLDQGLLTLIDSICHTPYPVRLVTTSQRALRLPAELVSNVREFRMDEGLEPADAVALLRSIATDAVGLDALRDEELERATQRLCGVPRGIELLANLLKDDPLAILDLLQSDATLDELMTELVSRAFLGLNENQRRVVELLALAEVPLLESEPPSILTGIVEAAEARAALRALVRDREVGFDARARTVRLHPLDGDWVRCRLLKDAQPMQVELDSRLAQWYQRQRMPADAWRTLADVTPHRREFHHRLRAGEPAAAIAVLAEAANFLARKGEAAALAGAISAAEALLPVGEPHMHLERCKFAVEFFAGSLDRAEIAVRAARAAAPVGALGDCVAELDVELGTVQRHRGDAAGAVETLNAVLQGEVHLKHRVRREALFELGLALCYEHDWNRAMNVAAELEQLLRPDDLRKIFAAPDDIRALAFLGAGDPAGALAAADRAIALYLASPHQDNVGYLYNVRGLVGLQRDDLDFEEMELRRGMAVGRDYRIDRIEGICATNLSWTLIRASKWTEAQETAQIAVVRLNATAVRAAQTPAALAQLAKLSEHSPRALEEQLLTAVEGSVGNTDLYTPTPRVLTEILKGLSGRQTS